MESSATRRQRLTGATATGNTFSAELLGADPRDEGGRRVLFLSGDDGSAKSAVAALFDSAGFFTIDLGDLVPGGRMQQFGGPLAGQDLVRMSTP